LRHAPKKL